MTATASQPTQASPRASLAILSSRTLRIALVLFVMWAALGLHPETREAFMTAGNFSNLTAQVAEIIIIGVGMTLVILIGGIDLSVGAGMALAGVIAAKLQIDHGQPAWVACLAAIAVCAVVGAWHGLLVTRFAVPPFIATLSGFLAYRGAALVLSDARGLSPMGEDFQRLGARISPTTTWVLVGLGTALGALLVVRRVARRTRLRLPVEPRAIPGLKLGAILVVAAFSCFVYREGAPAPVVIAALAAALGGFLLSKTRLGRYAFAIGGNAEAARLAGAPVARVTMALYVLLGVLTAFAGLVAAARTNGVTPGNAGLMRELHVITAVVIGGTSLSGGRGTMLGTVIGALIFGTLSNGMNLLGISSNWQLIVTGQILLAASLLDSFTSKKR